MSTGSNIASGAQTGATIGGTIGSFVPGIGTAIGGVAGGAIGGIAGGIFGKENKETPIQARQREMVDLLYSSVKGDGPFSNLFNVDEASFQKSFVDPMKQKFQSQIAPQIQQSYIASGQERGTGMEDALTRAGVDMDQLLNQYYSQQQQGAMNRQANTMGSMLGMQPGPQQTPTTGQAAMQGLGGYLQSDKFGQNLDDVLQSFQKRKGFENDARGPNELTDYISSLGKKNQVYNPYTGTQR